MPDRSLPGVDVVICPLCQLDTETPFCPSCGAPLHDLAGLGGLVLYCERVVSSLRTIGGDDPPEHVQNSIDLWERWIRELRRAIEARGRSD